MSLLTDWQATPPNIDAGTDQVRTSGYSSVGSGAAYYVADSNFDLVTFPRAGFTAADGRKFRLSYEQVITDFMFGAILQADNVDAIEAATAFTWANRCQALSCTSYGKASRTVLFGPNSQPATRRIHFGLTLRATAVMDSLVHIRQAHFCTIDFSGCVLAGRDSTFEDPKLELRLAMIGLRIEQAPRAFMIGTLKVIGFYYWGVALHKDCFMSGCRLPFIIALNCGSTTLSTNFNEISATWSGSTAAGARSGTVAGYEQKTTLNNVTNAPAYADPLNYQRLAKINGYYYPIESISGFGTGSHTLVLAYPWVPAVELDAGSGTIEYVFGGMLGIWGQDASRMHWAGGSANRCGFALLDQTLYGALVENLATEDTEVFWGIGLWAGTGASRIGGKIIGGYIEDTGTAQVISFSNNISGQVLGAVGGAVLSPSTRFYKLGPRNSAGTLNNQRMLELVSVEGAEGKVIIAQKGSSFSTTYNPPSIGAGQMASTTITIPGVQSDTHALIVKFTESLGGLMVFASITSVNAASGNGTATITFFNPTAGPVNPDEGTLTVSLMK